MVDEDFIDPKDRETFEKLKKSRTGQSKVRDVSEKAFYYMENRDKMGLIRLLDNNMSVLITDIVDSKGYTLMHMACFKNLEEIG